jgi:PEP-CTERM motif
MKLVKLIIGTIVLFVSGNLAYALPLLTGDTWSIRNSIDVSGNTWDTSTLVFTSQVNDGVDANLEGHFDWIGSRGQFGRETFSGKLFADLSLKLFGITILPPASGIAPADYAADVLADGSQIINGRWSASSVVPGTWEAVRSTNAVPEPGTLILLASLLGVSVAYRRRA